MRFFTVIKNIFKSIKIAIKEPYKYEVVDQAINGFSFDYAYLYDLERAKLVEMRNFFKNEGIAENSDDMVKKIDLAIKLLDIANESTDTFGYKFLDNGTSRSGGLADLDDEYYCKVNVNLKNANRFFEGNDFMLEYVKKTPHELYIRKAQYLYHKLRYYFEQSWWD